MTERINQVACRATIYSLLAQAVNYPDATLIGDLTDGGFTGSLLGSFAGLGLKVAAEDVAALKAYEAGDGEAPGDRLLELERDYTRMCFASKPRLVYLFESVYREGKLFQDSTFEVARLYLDAGLKVTEDFRLPPDHIALEFEFMAYLCFNEHGAIEAGDAAKAEYAVSLQKKMLGQHVRPFALAFSERLGAHANTGFYRAIGRLTQHLFSGRGLEPGDGLSEGE